MCRYFSTRNAARSGSFVRLEKLKNSALVPCSVLQALLRKYGNEQEFYQDTGMRIHRVKVQLVGMDKLRRQRGGVDKVQEVALLDAGISSAVSSLCLCMAPRKATAL
jgi:hypothetical protein